jgi:type 1 fimbria pilin
VFQGKLYHMKQFLYLTILLILLQSASGMAQVKDSTRFTQTIKGTVTDKATRLSLPGVTLKLTSVNPVKATASNATGAFRLSGVPVGRHILEVSYTGYQSVILSEVLVTTGKEAEVNIELDPQSKSLNEVVVNAASGKRPLNTMAMASARSFSPEETTVTPGAYLTLPGWRKALPG